ncbi:EamA/RhaT family transporter [Aerosticca soli]|jgi:drug/metabolite transporter (DMT)-like permease|uniref:Integral membrane protein n=1 Tax=Aerosticca soli TaxID=2010829 RepID=A0A2Z6E1D8_9GAMM|nr:EamA/RhaT family transporter [Aerosticca soli]BBD78795.1 integral membrane protein [Aerosticca soli]
MLALLCAVLASVMVSVLLKLASARGLDVAQMVAWNYPTAALLGRLALAPPQAFAADALPWPTLGLLGVLLPCIFLALGASVRSAGIVRTEVAQRLSLLFSLLAAFFLFGQTWTPRLAAGLLLGGLALVGLLARGPRETAATSGARYWPLVVCAGFAAIDVLLKHVAAVGVPLAVSLPTMFALATPVALLMALWPARRTPFTLRNLAAGVLLGALNFGNIYAYLAAHRALPDQPARVFAGMNLGVVALGTLVGVGVFGERLRWPNVLGLMLAAVAIVLLAR